MQGKENSPKLVNKNKDVQRQWYLKLRWEKKEARRG